MDSGIQDLVDLVSALRAEVRRLRAAAGHVLDKSSFNSSEELAELGGAMRKLQIELDRFAPSMTPEASKARKSSR
jgi:hypothetical protein